MTKKEIADFSLKVLLATGIVCALIFVSTAFVTIMHRVQPINFNNSMFELVEGNSSSMAIVVKDKETGVLYSVSSKGEFSLLVNEDGTPRVVEIEEKK